MSTQLGPDNEADYVDFVSDVWEFIGAHFQQWGEVARGEKDIRDIRQSYVHWHSGVISTIGEFVAVAMGETKESWQAAVTEALQHPKTAGWARDAVEWQGVIVSGMQILPRSLVGPQLRAYLKDLAGLKLTQGDESNLAAITKLRYELGV